MFYLLIWINEGKKIVKKNLRVMKIWSLGVKFEVKLHVAMPLWLLIRPKGSRSFYRVS